MFGVPNERRFCAHWGVLANASRSTPIVELRFVVAVEVLRLLGRHGDLVAQDDRRRDRRRLVQDDSVEDPTVKYTPGVKLSTA